ncbi:MAG: hypothetical protein AAGA56_11290 [Myxococcota bacterium]
MRACFGLVVSSAIGIVVTWLTEPEPEEKQRGLVWGRVPEAQAARRAEEAGEPRAEAIPARREFEGEGEDGLPLASLPHSVAHALSVRPGDRVFVTDSRWWLGGLYAAHAQVDLIHGDDETVGLGPSLWEAVVTKRRADKPLVILRL